MEHGDTTGDTKPAEVQETQGETAVTDNMAAALEDPSEHSEEKCPTPADPGEIGDEPPSESDWTSGDQGSGDDQSKVPSDAGGETTGDRRVPEASDQGAEPAQPYDQQEVVERYAERIQAVLKEMGSELKEMEDAEDLQWQVRVISSIVAAVPGDPGLGMTLIVETTDFGRQLELRSGTQTSAPTGMAPEPADVAQHPGLQKLLDKFKLKIEPDTWKLLSHLRTPKEWSITGEVSASAVFFGGKAGLSITFGQ